MLKVDWLDRLTFREIEMVNEVRCWKSCQACTFFLEKKFRQVNLVKINDIFCFLVEGKAEFQFHVSDD